MLNNVPDEDKPEFVLRCLNIGRNFKEMNNYDSSKVINECNLAEIQTLDLAIETINEIYKSVSKRVEEQVENLSNVPPEHLGKNQYKGDASEITSNVSEFLKKLSEDSKNGK